MQRKLSDKDEERYEFIRNLREAGMSYGEIGREIGKAEGTKPWDKALTGSRYRTLQRLKGIPVECMGLCVLSMRILHALDEAGYRTVEAVLYDVQMDDKKIRRLPNLGEKSFAELCRTLGVYPLPQEEQEAIKFLRSRGYVVTKQGEIIASRA